MGHMKDSFHFTDMGAEQPPRRVGLRPPLQQVATPMPVAGADVVPGQPAAPRVEGEHLVVHRAHDNAVRLHYITFI